MNIENNEYRKMSIENKNSNIRKIGLLGVQNKKKRLTRRRRKVIGQSHETEQRWFLGT